MRLLFARLSAQKAQTYDLILTASAIPHQLRSNNTGWQIDVAPAHRQTAVRAVSLYLTENQPEVRQPPVSEMHSTRTWSAFYVALLLLILHWAIRSGYERQVFIATYGADAKRILAGQLYRCVSALLLHADWSHVLSNAVGLALFGTAVASTCGWGVGWLMILLAGSSGNLINALWHGEAHLSVGASTAVFGAVGLCAALTFGRRMKRAGRSWRSWTPLAGGLALLAFMGAAPGTDLLAHFFGFTAGVALGVVYLWRIRQVLGWPAQLSAALLALSLAIGSWLWGMLL